ncbi:hypothetical protein KC19_2G186400 [Ceratodon purpureus]|uniref:diacylglycerol O-acyltransferase n=1 Tax=Ceratodon purpureus TaxID=3225 RepID=A0A8T0IY89_CERPU|nr:hypothetical protein KC19_2G186400 [Ceratodon purpureus]
MKPSRLFKSQVTVHGNGPEEYLKLTKSSMEQVQRLTSLSGFISLNFNHEQCKYLADKLELAVKSADSFLVLLSKGYFWFPSPEDKASCLKIFKLLYASAKEVENFIQSQCSKDAWIQAAMSLTNVLSIGFNLELWTLVFSKSEKLRARRSFTLTKVDAVFKAEAKIVEERALRDRDLLLRYVNSVLRTKKPTSIEYQLAGLLRERLEPNRLIPAGDFPGSSHSDLSSETVFSSEEQMKQLGETFFKSLKVKDQLGKGAAATVNRAYWMGGEAAIKTFIGPNNNDFKKEVAILRKLSHPNIISLLCSTADERSCSIVVELMDGDLTSLMYKRLSEGLGNQESPFDIMEGLDIMLQVGGGMQYLHDMKIVHRDLKSMNILVRCVSAQEIEYVVAKVADFGLSKTKERSMTYSNQTLNLGTTRWMAPEMMIQSFNAESEVEMAERKATVMNYPFKSDIYSFGMLCFEILTGHVPFSDVPPRIVRELVVSGGRPPLPSQCPPLLKSLIERCWNQDPSKRPSFGEICAELRHLKCELLMPLAFSFPAALGEVSPSGNIPERPSASDSSTPVTHLRQSHAGLFNLCIVVLIAVNSWLIIENLMKYGLLINSGFWFSSESARDWPLLMCCLSLPIFPLSALLVEKLYLQTYVSEGVIFVLHLIISSTGIVYPAYVIHRVQSALLPGLVLILIALIGWMKLLSYAHANKDVREILKAGEKPDIPQRAENVEYPDNLTIKNIAYFMLAPTLCYQSSYPRSETVRKGWVLRQVGKLVVFLGLIGFIIEQYINPILSKSQHPLKGNYLYAAERILKLSMPVLYVWLCMFYCFFHLWLNIVAELLRFGDREFYKDWWNAKTVEEYWRMWNMPGHKWMVRHIYFPCIRAGLRKEAAVFLVFLISALFHEFAIGVPCHMLRCWAFLGIMMQVPLVYLTNLIRDRWFNSMVGNMVFWFSFCIVGQPMCLLLYYHDVVNNTSST